ncbi:hypothetical protein AK812_SmicGene16935 [Symbiodinium microadriaticum]|uniref:Uncharacterized protein n=1 Tax=Symbiodinium microadriaticum TaxID=2951 RepID=A0A1Q9DZ02_SYMMI|nr:hypothetical protein AK812_SmicGene16935 [Symbiodinium microadriaticum]
MIMHVVWGAGAVPGTRFALNGNDNCTGEVTIDDVTDEEALIDVQPGQVLTARYILAEEEDRNADQSESAHSDVGSDILPLHTDQHGLAGRQAHEASIQQAAFRVLIPCFLFIQDYSPEFYEIPISLPTTVADIVELLPGCRSLSRQEIAPLPCVVRPQPDTAYASFLMLPSWPLEDCMILVDGRTVDDRIFALRVAPLVDKRSLLLAAAYDPGRPLLVFIRDSPWPLRDDAVSPLYTGDLVVICLAEHLTVTVGYLPAMLQSPDSWDSAGVPQEPLDEFALVLHDGEPFLMQHGANRDRGDDSSDSADSIDQRVAAGFGVDESEITLYAPCPEIEDHWERGPALGGQLTLADASFDNAASDSIAASPLRAGRNQATFASLQSSAPLFGVNFGLRLELHQMLEPGHHWDLSFELPGDVGDINWILSDGIHTALPIAGDNFALNSAHTAAALGLEAGHFQLVSASPSISDHAHLGIRSQRVLSACLIDDPWSEGEDQRVPYTLDQRPVLLPLLLAYASGGMLDVSEICRRAAWRCPRRHHVRLFGGQPVAGSGNHYRQVGPGDVITIEFHPDRVRDTFSEYNSDTYTPDSGQPGGAAGPPDTHEGTGYPSGDTGSTSQLPASTGQLVQEHGGLCSDRVPLTRPLPTPCRSFQNRIGHDPSSLWCTEVDIGSVQTLLEESAASPDCEAFWIAATLLDTIVEHFSGRDIHPASPRGNDVIGTYPSAIIRLADYLPPVVSFDLSHVSMPLCQSIDQVMQWTRPRLWDLERDLPAGLDLHSAARALLEQCKPGEPSVFQTIFIYTDGSLLRGISSWAFVVFGYQDGQLHFLGWAAGKVPCVPEHPLFLCPSDPHALSGEQSALLWSAIWALQSPLECYRVLGLRDQESEDPFQPVQISLRIMSVNVQSLADPDEARADPVSASGFTGRARYLREQFTHLQVHVSALQEARTKATKTETPGGSTYASFSTSVSHRVGDLVWQVQHPPKLD